MAKIIVFLFTLIFSVMAICDEQQPFTVDIMMQTQGLGEALFGPKGKHLLIEKTAAYENSVNFAWERAWSRERATLLDVSRNDEVIQTVSPGDKERVWFGSYSPSGGKAAVGWFDGDQAKAGVYNFKTNRLIKFDYLISNGACAFDCPFWLSEDEYIHYTLSADEQKKQMSHIIYTDELTSRWGRQAWAGKKAAVKVLGSGDYQSKQTAEGGQLIRVNVRTGKMAVLGEGLFSEFVQSSNWRRLAVIHETGSLDNRHLKAQAINGADKILELVVYDFTDGFKKILPCESCNVTPGSLRWSPRGDRLFFGSRVLKDGEFTHNHHIYDFNLARLQRFAPAELAFETVVNLRRGEFVVPFLWLDNDTPVIRVANEKEPEEIALSENTSSGKNGKTTVRYDWYALPVSGEPVALTAGLNPMDDEAPLEDYTAVHEGRVLMMADGELWSLSANGGQKNLTRDISEKLSPWCSVIAYWREAGVRPVCKSLHRDMFVRPIDAAALAQGWVTFRVMNDRVPTGDLLFLNVDSGEIARIEKPGSTAELVTVSPLARSALYRGKADDGDHLMLVQADGVVRELLHFNRQLQGVVGGEPVMLTRREPGEDKDRIDWLLLPPDHREGDRHPLLVYFYPDTEYSREWRSNDLRDVNFLNQHIPAARGYAVLLATMKISTYGEAGDPMTQMHEQLIHAAENAVAQGYADPERWAIMGHSYGGYGTNSVITQTNRFKAAVSLAGLANLTSGYAIGLGAEKATSVAAGLAFGARWSEGGQGRMGVAPWRDPQRYIRNSPLFYADNIETPLMLVHGDYDFVNAGEAEQMFNALHRQGKDAIFLRYWGEGHVLRGPANIRDMWARIFAWFDDHLGPIEGR